MRPVRSLQIPPEIGKSPTDFTDLHRFWTCSAFGKKHADFADDADSFVGDLFFCPTDFTDLHRFWTCSVFEKKHADFADSFVGDLFFFCPTDFTDIHRFWTCSVFGKKHADFADDAVFLFGYLGNFPYDYGKNESV